MRLASHIGLWLVLASLLLIAYIVIGYFSGSAVQGWTSTMLVVVALGAVQMFVLGMIGEYLGRLYIESKHRPLYIVADIAGQAHGRAGLGHVAALATPTPLSEHPAPLEGEGDQRHDEQHRDHR
jgi:dolichol-phosphate mannosyltransferase